MGQYGFLNIVSIYSFMANLEAIVDKFGLPQCCLKSIPRLKLMQFKIKKIEQKWFNYESKGEHLNLIKIELWISLLDKL